MYVCIILSYVEMDLNIGLTLSETQFGVIHSKQTRCVQVLDDDVVCRVTTSLLRT